MLGRRAHRHRTELRDRASRQAAIATLGQEALSGIELDELLDASAAAAARELGADQIAVLERTRDGEGMLARAGVGLPEGVLGGVLPPDPSRLKRDLGSRSVTSARIAARGLDFGVIEAHSRRSEEHTSELQSHSDLVCR